MASSVPARRRPHPSRGPRGRFAAARRRAAGSPPPRRVADSPPPLVAWYLEPRLAAQPAPFRATVAAAAFLLVGAVAFLAPDAGRAEPRPRRPAPSRPAPSGSSHARYVSAQAYLHALRAELLLARGEVPQAAEELQLAIVYDSESAHLHAELAGLCLELGSLPRAEKLAERVIALAPADPDSWTLRAKVHLARAQPLAAELALRRALERAPSHVEAALALAERLQARGRLDEAAAVLAASAVRAERSTAPLAALARLELGRRRWPRAAAALERAVARDPRSFELTAELANVYERLGRWADAGSAWRALLLRLPDHPGALFEAARTALWVGEDEVADGFVRSIQWIDPAPSTSHRLGLLYLSEGRFSPALGLLSESVRAEPPGARERYAYAAALAGVGEDEAALAELEMIAPEEEPYVSARLRIGELLLGLGRLDRARLAAVAALDHHPRSSALLLLYAQTLERAGKRGEARDVLRAARAGGADTLELAAGEAAMAIRAGERDRGIELMRSAVAAADGPSGTSSEEAQYRLAEVLRLAGAVDAAEDAVKRAIELEPDSTRALGFLSYLWADRGVHLEDATRLARRALAVDPRSGAIIDTLGLLAMRQGRLDEAEVLLRRAARLLPGDPDVQEHAAELMLARGRPDGARPYLLAARAALERAARARAPGVDVARARIEDRLTALPGPRSAAQ